MEDLREQGIKFLEPILEQIDNKGIREFTYNALQLVPIDFFRQPASSTGKYHPNYSLGVGGLLRHTKAACVLALDLFNIYDFRPKKQDMILSALILHDTEKPDKLHPILVKRRLESLNEFYWFDDIIELIEAHMGQWNHFGKLPKPTTEAERFVHLCDYLASRKEITVEVYK